VILSREEQDALLAIARGAIAVAIGAADRNGSENLFPAENHEKGFPEPFRGGAFVSIHLGHDLRGCVGYPESDLELPDVVRRCAVSAATSDHRFPPLTPAEWARATVEISVLGPIEPVGDASEIEVGRHGLIAQMGHRRGLLLPQVATERGWKREEFAAQTCRKAGLPLDAWRTGAQLFKFEAQVFADPAAS
jgi:AmmeMemoRadiSam system protein A